jgi:hypothetical protein
MKMKAKYQILNDGKWVAVTNDIFMSWTGDRKLNGEDYHGPVINYLSGEKEQGK